MPLEDQRDSVDLTSRHLRHWENILCEGGERPWFGSHVGLDLSEYQMA